MINKNSASATAEAVDTKATATIEAADDNDDDGGGGSDVSSSVEEASSNSSSSSSPSSPPTAPPHPPSSSSLLPPTARRASSCRKKCNDAYTKNSFLILVIFAILFAYAYPPLGAIYLRPDVTSDWIAVVLIFVLSGMGIKTEEFGKAFQRLRFNAYVQAFNFGAVSGIAYGFSRLMLAAGALPSSLADGMVVCSCLPVTVSMVMVLTKSSNGDEASAVFHAAFGNMLGIFLSPALIALYLGVDGETDVGAVTIKLVLRVLVPLLVGQFLRRFVPPARNFVDENSAKFKKLQEWLLVFIVYTVFCETFLAGSDATAGEVGIMIAMQGGMLVLVMILAWTSLGVLFRNEPKLRATGLFVCTHKTVALGIPLINSMYSDAAPALVGMYTLPLLVWHPMQLLLGTAVAPRVAEWVDGREKAGPSSSSSAEGDDAPPV
jgi:sodium/bile acid cotransporter 7